MSILWYMCYKERMDSLQEEWKYIETFGSLIEAAMSCNLKSTGRITNACRDWNKTSGGYKWKYKKNK